MGERTCSVDGCERTDRLKRGMCVPHYVRFMKYGQTESPPRAHRLCSVESCGRKHAGRGWCRLHYERVKNTGSLELSTAPPKLCTIDGCGEPATDDGAARGWCRHHYGRWYRHGDPLGIPLPPAPVVGVEPCTVDGCLDLVFARSWCIRHYTRWLRRGDPLARLRGEVRDGRRVCARCKKDKLIDEFGGSYCRPCNVQAQATSRASNPEPDWRAAARRRARMNAVPHEDFDRVEIFERDAWICQICSTPVDRERPWRKPNSPSLDHIVPIARGGEHTRANAQTACLRCNMRKGARVT